MLGGRQQMRPDCAMLATVSGMRLCSSWGRGGEKVGCVNLKVTGHGDGEGAVGGRKRLQGSDVVWFHAT